MSEQYYARSFSPPCLSVDWLVLFVGLNCLNPAITFVNVFRCRSVDLSTTSFFWFHCDGFCIFCVNRLFAISSFSLDTLDFFSFAAIVLVIVVLCCC